MFSSKSNLTKKAPDFNAKQQNGNPFRLSQSFTLLGASPGHFSALQEL
jgi:hypothetical protein